MQRQNTNPRLAFVSLSLLYFLVSAGTFSSLGMVLPAMVAEQKWSWTEAGMGYTLLGVSCGLASFLPAVLIRRIGVPGALALGTLLLMGGFAVLATVRDVWAYLGASLMIGTAFALTTTVPGAHVLTTLFRRRSTVLGAYFTSGALGGVAGPPFYVLVQAASSGWRAYWWAIMALAAVIGLFAVLTTRGTGGTEAPTASDGPEPVTMVDAPAVAAQQDWTVRRALGAWQYYVIVGAYTTNLLINTTAHGFAVEHLTERGVDPKVAAGMLSVEALVGAAVSVIGGVIGEKLSSRTLMIVALGALVIGMEGLTLAHGMGPAGLALMGLCAIGIGAGVGLAFIASTLLLLQYFGRRPNLELYSIMCLISTLAALGPAFGGWMRDRYGNFVLTFEICSVLTLAVLAGLCLLRPPMGSSARGNIP
jgi:cyanate permease